MNLRLLNGKTPLDLAISADSSGSHMMRLLRKQVSLALSLSSLSLSLFPLIDRHNARATQEANGTVKHRSVKTINKALLKFKRSSQHEDEPISLPHLQTHAKQMKWRHLKAQQVCVLAHTGCVLSCVSSIRLVARNPARRLPHILPLHPWFSFSPSAGI